VMVVQKLVSVYETRMVRETELSKRTAL